MKVIAFTPKGEVTLDLTNAKDIETFGGQAAVDRHTHNVRVNEKIVEMAEAEIAKEEGSI